MTTARAMLCDLDGTLYRQKPVKLRMALEVLLFGLGSQKVLRTFRHAHEALREELRVAPGKTFAPSPFEEQVRRTALSTGKSESEVRSVITDWMIERPGRHLARAARTELFEEIRTFRASGGKTAVVSDYPARKKIEALGITELFDVVVASGEEPGLGRLKPSPDGYRLAAERLGVPPEECLVLGDREDADGDAARALGMQFRLVR